MFEESPFLIPFISLLLTVVGFIATFFYFKSTAKAKRNQDNKEDVLSTEDRARDKQKDEMFLAKEVKEEARKVAVEVKEEMLEKIHNIVNELKGDINTQRIILQSELSLMKQSENQIRTDLVNHIKDQQSINDRMEKSLNFVSQFLWGQGAKSIPPYLQGMEETEEHKREPPEGIYKSPDSTETQEMKDTQGGTDTSERIAKEVEREDNKS